MPGSECNLFYGAFVSAALLRFETGMMPAPFASVRHGRAKTMTDITRRQFVKTVAGTGAAFTILPRHVLGRGMQAPSDTVNVAAVGIGGMGGSDLAPS